MAAAKSKTAATDSKHGVQAAETVLQVLSSFVGAGPMPMLKTLAERADMHPAKVHRYLVSLCRMGYVEQDSGTSRYRLGPLALRLGFAAMSTVDAVRVGRPLLYHFCQELKETVVLAIWSGGAPTIAAKEVAPSPITVAAPEGSSLPLLRSAIGRAFGAWLPREKIDHLLSEELAQLRSAPQPGCPRTQREAEELFEEIRKRGLARVTGQLSSSVHALAAPVFDSTSSLVAVLGAVGPAKEFDSTWNGPTAKTLQSAALTLSKGLGYLDGA